MGKIFVMMGKSASGKDTLFDMVKKDQSLKLQKIVIYTTRPIRDGETEGVQYHFVTDDIFEDMMAAGVVIEHRTYSTVMGPWHYFTADDGQIDLENNSYILIGTLESYLAIRKYYLDRYQKDLVYPVYVEVEDGIRLQRALEREMRQKEPKYEELCRRFLADCKDFSEENIRNAGIGKRYINKEIKDCFDQIREDLLHEIGEM